VLIRRVAGRWVCPQCGTPYHEDTDPPRESGRCDRDGTQLTQRDDDRPEVVRARIEKQVPPMLEVVDHYERAGIVHRLDGRKPIEEVTDDILAKISARAAS
jgi:adenylate kinase